MKKSKIKKIITRKISTGQYENIDITVEANEDIEWETIEERIKKTDNITRVLIMDFESTKAKVLEQFGIKNK
jgi:putative lipoic acid-binding regulatory protein